MQIERGRGRERESEREKEREGEIWSQRVRKRWVGKERKQSKMWLRMDRS